MKKIIITILIIIIPFISLCINYTSKDNNSGLWNNTLTWNGNIPTNDNINLSGGILTINGFVKWNTTNSSDSTLTLSGGGGGNIIINDTLVIYGNLELGNKYNLTVNGILIVYGDIITTNIITISSSGYLIVSGDMDFGGSQGLISSGSEQNVYIGGTCSNGTGCANTSNDTTDLENSNIDVDDFYRQNDPHPCPKTGPSFYIPNFFNI